MRRSAFSLTRIRDLLPGLHQIRSRGHECIDYEKNYSHGTELYYTFIYEDGGWPLRRLNQPITSTLNEKNLYVKLSDWYVVTPRAYLSPVGEEVDEELAFIPG